jgi:hypothetical protein
MRGADSHCPPRWGNGILSVGSVVISVSFRFRLPVCGPDRTIPDIDNSIA